MAPRPPVRPVRFLPALLVLALGPGATPVAGSPDDGFQDTGERFRTSILGTEFRVLRNPATREKALERADGRRFASVPEAVLDEEAGLTPLRRTVHPDLIPAVEDPARADETLRVVLVLADQPLHAASRAVRERVEPGIRVRLLRMREILARIGEARAEDPQRELQVGDRFEEERRLLSEEERAELRRLRTEVQGFSRGMRPEILASARPATETSQAPVVAYLETTAGARVLGRFRVLNAVATVVPAGRIADLLAALPEVVRVLPHRTRRTSLNTSVTTIGASGWTGYDGSSTTKVAVLDTGIDSGHPAFARSDFTSVITDQQVFLSAGDDNPGFWDDASSTDDIYGHGTHVGGIVMSANTTYKGVAPGGSLMNGKCGYLFRYFHAPSGQWLFDGALEDADIMAAGDWAADNGADTANCSFGGEDTTDGSSALTLFFDALADDLGVSVAVAAGNYPTPPTPSNSVGVPADGFNVVTTGSFSDNNTTTHADNSLSTFSCLGPLDDGRRKPDLCAPGQAITSCNPKWEGEADFVAWDGTSMATPHVAGALALLEDYAASWRPETMRALLMDSTRNTSPYPSTRNNSWGTGGLDLAAAYTARASVLEGTLTAAGPAVAFVRSGALSLGKRATLCWNREVHSAGASTPTTYRAPMDLDLYVYEESDDTPRGSSTSALDTAEQVAMSSSSTFPILKIHRYSDFPPGQSSVSWSIATEATTFSKLVTPPDLTCAFTSIPEAVGGTQQFTVTVTVTNNGELPATNPTLTLTLPPSYSLVSGANPATVVTIPAVGATRTASWTVKAGGFSSGSRTFSVAASTNSFGETFNGPSAQFVQTLDTVAPEGVLVVAGGKAAVKTAAVSLALFGIDDSSGVDSMCFRNAGGAWSAWLPFSDTSPWTLPSPDGTKTVDSQLRDGVGNLSGVMSDSIVLDSTVPAGGLRVADDAEYVMPWESLTAATTIDDGADGSGVEEYRYRWGDETWTGWLSPVEATVALERPDFEGVASASVQFRDLAGNISPASADGVYLVESAPPSLTAAKAYAGVLAAGGDLDPFTVDAVAGDTLTLKVKSRAAVRGADFRAETDLFGPDGVRVAEGRYPSDARRPGILKFPIAATGTHWVVLRPAGADRAAGGSYALTVRVVTAKGNRRWRGAAEPTGDPPTVTRTFDAAESFVLRGTVRASFVGPLSLLTPDGDTVPLPSVLLSGGARRKILPTVLAAGTGTYTLIAPASGAVLFDLSVAPPKRVKLEEPE